MTEMLEHMDAYYLRRIMRRYFIVIWTFPVVHITFSPD